MAELPSLSLAEWIVLTLVDEEPKHGFAVAAITAEDGDLGRAWHIPRPVVYRALDRLADAGFVRVRATEAGARGPQRSILAATANGRRATSRWLAQPAAHVRDLRSELLVKLGLLSRRGLEPDNLIKEQREVLQPVLVALEARLAHESGYGAIMLRWRVENLRAALHFLDAVTSDA